MGVCLKSEVVRGTYLGSQFRALLTRVSGAASISGGIGRSWQSAESVSCLHHIDGCKSNARACKSQMERDVRLSVLEAEIRRQAEPLAAARLADGVRAERGRGRG